MRNKGLWPSEYWIAHRGLFDHTGWMGQGKDIVPENSLAAFKLAIDHQFAVELDIAQGRGGDALIFHDDTLIRMAGKEANILRISKTDAGKINLLNSQETIPTFEDMLELVQGRIGLFLEIKVQEPFSCGDSESIRFLNNIQTSLRNYKHKYPQAKFTIQSFCPEVLYWMKENAPDYIIGLISYDYQDDHGLGAYQGFVRSNLLTALLLNPDYIAYDIEKISSLSYLQKMMFYGWIKILKKPMVYWTYLKQHHQKGDQKGEIAKSNAKGLIFEGFMPNDSKG